VASNPPALVHIPHQTSHSCPNQLCPICKKAPQAFLYHSDCHELHERTQNSKLPADCASIELLCDLGRALAPILPIDQPSGPDLALQLLKRSFSGQTLAKLSTYHAWNKDPRFIQLLSTLPTEILSEFVAPRIIPSQLQYALPVLGETYQLLQRLHQWPAVEYTLCCRGAIFVKRSQFGNRSYITDLSTKESKGYSLVKSRDVSCGFVIVYLDKVGIPDIEFQESSFVELARRNSKWVYAVAVTEGKIYVQSKVCAWYTYNILLTGFRVSSLRELRALVTAFPRSFGTTPTRHCTSAEPISKTFVTQIQKKMSSSITSLWMTWSEYLLHAVPEKFLPLCNIRQQRTEPRLIKKLTRIPSGRIVH